MEEENAAAYYDELTRKGEGAARFKQGLGFSSSTAATSRNDDVPTRGSALPPSSSSSFLSSFVRASSPTKSAEFQKQSQLESIQNKLKNKPQPRPRASRDATSRSPIRDRDTSRDRDRDRDRDRGRDRGRVRDRDRDRDRHYKTRSRSRSRESRHRHQRRSLSRERNRDKEKRRRRSRSASPGRRRSEKEGGNDVVVRKGKKDGNGGIHYAKLIEGYDKMSPAERVKAKMKFQLSETAEKDAMNGMGSGWERFEFNKDAPLDDEEMEAADDDVALVEHLGQSFRFSAVEAKREDQIRAAHDEAIFGSSHVLPSVDTKDIIEEESRNKREAIAPATNLLSETVIASQRGSWRDRARKA